MGIYGTGIGGKRNVTEFYYFVGNYGKGNAWDLCGYRAFDSGGKRNGEAIPQE
jgi:hypothetical protein